MIRFIVEILTGYKYGALLLSVTRSKNMMRINLLISVLTASLTLASCGGGGGGSSTFNNPFISATVLSKVEAFKFLNQATFGATEAEASRLIALGDTNTAYARWLDLEFLKPASLILPTVEAAFPNPIPTGFNVSGVQATRLEKWFDNALHGNDQLRQRVAFALSEILVVSQVGALQNFPSATADYHDTLARGAFSNFRTLLEEVSLHPAMGLYLNMLGNQKTLTGTNLRPDENYARELMQLFTIGVAQINIDGSVKTDAAGLPLPSYEQNVVEGFARAFTGWNWACPTTRTNCIFTNTIGQFIPVEGYNQIKPIQQYVPQHETGTKQLLNYNGVSLSGGLLPANQTGLKDLQDALDNIFNHPNVGPFISKQLIKKLVTSNPSPAYIQRVSEKFNNDGTGRRGNLEAVVRAILLDTEARSTSTGSSAAAAGKIKEPLLRLTQFWRAYSATSASGKMGASRNFSGGTVNVLGQATGVSPSVFNFFSPDFAPIGEISDSGRVAPEMELATEYLNTQLINFFWITAIARTQLQAATLNSDDMYINTTEEFFLAADSEALINRVAEKLLGGTTQMSAVLKSQAKAQIERTVIPATNPTTAIATRTADAIYFVAISAQFAVSTPP